MQPGKNISSEAKENKALIIIIRLLHDMQEVIGNFAVSFSSDLF